LVRDHANGRDLISQPNFERLGVSDGRRTKTEGGPDFRAVALPCPARHIMFATISRPYTELPGDTRHGRIIDFIGYPGESSVRPAE
jgi:hypothetical protein